MGTNPAIINALPLFSPGTSNQDDLAVSNPAIQALLSQTGNNHSNVDAQAASNPQFGNFLSMLSPQGGLNPQQSAAFGPLFSLLFSMQGGTQAPGTLG